MILSAGTVAFAAALAAADGPTVLSAENSVGPGESAQYQFEGSVVFRDGFRLDHGVAEFRSGGSAPRAGLATTTGNGISSASMSGGLLRLEYRLSEALPVTVAAYSTSGRLLERWRLNPGAGSQVAELKMRKSPRAGRVLLRLNAGNLRFARTVAVH
jgi:hypothetical protein